MRSHHRPQQSTFLRKLTSSFSPSPITIVPSILTVFNTLRIMSTAACVRASALALTKLTHNQAEGETIKALLHLICGIFVSFSIPFATSKCCSFCYTHQLQSKISLHILVVWTLSLVCRTHKLIGVCQSSVLVFHLLSDQVSSLKTDTAYLSLAWFCHCRCRYR